MIQRICTVWHRTRSMFANTGFLRSESTDALLHVGEIPLIKIFRFVTPQREWYLSRVGRVFLKRCTVSGGITALYKVCCIQCKEMQNDAFVFMRCSHTSTMGRRHTLSFSTLVEILIYLKTTEVNLSSVYTDCQDFVAQPECLASSVR